jgi:hypothetical protein
VLHARSFSGTIAPHLRHARGAAIGDELARCAEQSTPDRATTGVMGVRNGTFEVCEAAR